ncbi:MAG: hypothetical protein NTV48_00015 [Candidatus Vogelbacteria bacterium]|nr:hypothetical protein [Candidatus Vogelbacteria bacterium]
METLCSFIPDNMFLCWLLGNHYMALNEVLLLDKVAGVIGGVLLTLFVQWLWRRRNHRA